jgi:hypothetical protein
LCHDCNRWCEDHPALAADTGWKISRKYGHDPQLREDEALDLNGDIVRFEVAS